MSLSSISEMRALLAAQPEAPAKPASLSEVVRTLFTPKTDGGLQRVELGPPAAAPVEILDAAPPPPPGRAFIPPELMLGAFGPRRSEFGQRAQGASGRRRPFQVEEVLPRDRIEEFGRSSEDFSVRSIAASEAETPFFPGDLLDEDRPFVLSSFGRIDGSPDAAPAARAFPEPAEAPRESPELRQTFLLASLAAKLAAEGALIAGHLAAARAAVFEPVSAAA